MIFKRLRLALCFLTILPIAPSEKVSEKDWGRSIKYFSAVGVLYGLMNLALILGFRYLAEEGLINVFASKPWLLALVLLLANVFLSGGLHLDGLMDSFDGVAAHKKSLEETRMVLKDSRVGAFGAMAGFLILIAKLLCLAELNWQEHFAEILFTLALLPAISRLLMVLIVAFQCKPQATAQELTGGIFNRIKSIFSNILRKEPSFLSESSAQVFSKHMRKVLDIVLNILILKAFALVLLGPSLIYSFYPGYFDSSSFLNELLARDYIIDLGSIIKLDLIFISTLIFGYIFSLALRKRLFEHNGDSLGASLELTEAIGFLLIAISF